MGNNIEQDVKEKDRIDLSFEVISDKELIDSYNKSSEDKISPDLESLVESSYISSDFDSAVSKADKNDYLIAIASGTLSATVDILWTGSTSLLEAREWGNDLVCDMVVKLANNRGYRGSDLSSAISFLEKNYPLASDKLTAQFGGGLQHHLRDFSHHCSIVGLAVSIISQFTGMGYGTTTAGKFVAYPLPADAIIGKNVSEKIFFGTIGWAFHLASDMAGSSQNAGRGTGIPGLVLSLLKELSALPIMRSLTGDNEKGNNRFSVFISKLFNGTEIDGVRFDLRTEIGIGLELSKQSIPVIVNECITRTCYFVKQLINTLRESSINSFDDFFSLDFRTILPINKNNRRLSRMLLVSSGVFSAVEGSAAFAEAYLKNGGFSGTFAADFIGRINIIGIGRFVIACKTDAKYLADDMKKKYIDYCVKHNQTAKRIYELLPVLQILSITPEQKQVLLCLEYTKAANDYYAETNEKRKQSKYEWMVVWRSNAVKSLPKDNRRLSVFQSADQVDKAIKAVQEKEHSHYRELICLELALFKPFTPLNNMQRKIKCVASSDNSVFYRVLDSSVNIDMFEELEKTHERYYKKLLELNKQEALAIFAISAAIANLTSSIIANSFNSTGAYQSSLVSLFISPQWITMNASLLLGGGAILLNSIVASNTDILPIRSKEEIAYECAKLLTFSKVFLANNPDEIEKIQLAISQTIEKIEERKTELEKDLYHSCKKILSKAIKELKTLYSNTK